jgi:hypothetical protein
VRRPFGLYEGTTPIRPMQMEARSSPLSSRPKRTGQQNRQGRLLRVKAVPDGTGSFYLRLRFA